MATRKLYELVGADPARRFSPFSWSSRFALAHKGLEADIVPSRFGEKDKAHLQQISGQMLVPVLVDGEKVVSDSWEIACHLEDAYPDAPSLFGGNESGKSMCYFIVHWTNTALNPLISKIVVWDVWNVAAEEDKVYFRESREKRFGMTLEEYVKDPTNIANFRTALQPLRLLLATQPFLGGSKPNYADYTVFGSFMWAKCVSPKKLLEGDDPVYFWRSRMLDLFDGMGAKAVGLEV